MFQVDNYLDSSAREEGPHPSTELLQTAVRQAQRLLTRVWDWLVWLLGMGSSKSPKVRTVPISVLCCTVLAFCSVLPCVPWCTVLLWILFCTQDGNSVLVLGTLHMSLRLAPLVLLYSDSLPSTLLDAFSEPLARAFVTAWQSNFLKKRHNAPFHRCLRAWRHARRR